jgi:hypothetical protein
VSLRDGCERDLHRSFLLLEEPSDRQDIEERRAANALFEILQAFLRSP